MKTTLLVGVPVAGLAAPAAADRAEDDLQLVRKAVVSAQAAPARPPAEGPAPPAAARPAPRRDEPQWFRVRIEEKAGKKARVSVNFPLGLVQIAEKVSAVQRSTSKVEKGATLDASVTALPFFSSNSFKRASASGESANTFSGKGAVESSNDFSGTITVVVREVQPNGTLLVAGEKQIGVNANVDVLRFSGQVDPRAIQPGNTVASSAIANVRIEQRGRGQQAEAQSMGWLARFFLTLMPI